MKTKSAKLRRRGRKRKAGQRYRCGRLSITPDRNDGNTNTVFETRCRQDEINPKKADRKEILDPLRGHVLGRLLLSEMISEAQNDAGQKYEKTYHNWARTNDIPRITPPAGSYGQSVPGRDDVPDDEAKVAQRAYFEVADALEQVNRGTRWEVIRVCLEGAEPKNIAALCFGLDRLVSHYG